MKASVHANIARSAVLVLALTSLSGCVTGTTIEAAREQVHYKQQKVQDGKITPLEIESVEKAEPGYYALVPFAVAADVALLPVYVGWVIGVWAGWLEP